MMLVGCVGPIGAENASAHFSAEPQIALAGESFSVDLTIDVAEVHFDTAYVLQVLGRAESNDWLALASIEKSGLFSGNIEIVFPEPGSWETEVSLAEPESGEALLHVSGPEIEVFDEGALNITPAKSYETWITGEPMPLVPSISPEGLVNRLDWSVEILRGDDWQELLELDPTVLAVPSFEASEEGVNSLRLVAYSYGKRFAEGVPFEVYIASPGTLIRDLWQRENRLSTPEQLWEEISSATYPGIQNPTDEDRSAVIQSYERQGMPRTSVLLETLVKVPEIDLANQYNGRPCSDSDVLSTGIEGTHFMYDVDWFRTRLTVFSTFFDGRMYQHRTLCF